MNSTMNKRAPVGRARVAAITIDCPRENCGGGIESPDNGSFTLTDEDIEALVPGSTHLCGTCLEPITVPARARKMLEVGSQG